MDKYLLTADEIYDGMNIDNLEQPWNPKMLVLVIFFAILVTNSILCD